MSFLGPRPHRSPLDTSSHSITPLAPRVMVTRPSDACAAAGMKIPIVRRNAASTSGRCTIWGKCGEPISSSPSATSTKLSGGLRPAPRMAWSAARNVASGPFWFTAPRPMSTLPRPGRSMRAAVQGGDDHSAGSACLTSYMKYRPSVCGAPASSVAKMPGCPSVAIFVTWSKPASRNSRMVSSQPSSMPRFSAAIDGCLIHSWRRATASSWRFSICSKMGVRSDWGAPRRGQASAAAAAALPSRKVRRSSVMGDLTMVCGWTSNVRARPHVGRSVVTAGPALRGREPERSIWQIACGSPHHLCGTTRGGFVIQRCALLLALATLVGVAGASAQERQITGRVTASTGEGGAGAAVSVTGTAFAAVTNADGRYTIPAPASAVTLVVRRIAFKRREVPVPAGQTTADVVLEPDVFNLEAVVVTGQATGVERRNAAMATTNVSGEQVSQVPSPALDRALAGRVPGAIISQNSGAPGGGTQIQIRGNNTVIGSPDPLFVVDGVIYSDASLPSGLFTVTGSSANRGNGELQDDPVNRLADLNPSDIESVEVLRGAAAASIYGSKAANGVIVVRTNRGKAGKARATVTQRLGFFDLLRGPATRSFTEAEALDLYASSPSSTAADTALIKSYEVNGQLPTYDHLQEIAGNKPLSYEPRIDVSGGSENTRYFLSGS